MINVINRPTKIQHFALDRIIIQGVNAKITAGKVLVNVAPDVITGDHAVIGGVGVVFGRGTKGRHFNQFTTRVYMGKLKPLTNDATATTKNRLNLMGTGVGHGIKILGGKPKQAITHATADDISIKACPL